MNRLLRTLAKTAPSINPAQVILTGATQIRTAFQPDQVPIVIDAYMAGIKVVFAISTAIVGAGFLFTFLGPKNRINKEALKQGGGVA